MKSTNEWLDVAKAKSGSDYKTAKAIGVTPQAINKARHARTMHNNTARKLAEYLGVNPLEIIASMEAERHPEEAGNWQKWVAACLVSGLLIISGNPVNEALSEEIIISNAIDYAKWLMVLVGGLVFTRLRADIKMYRSINA